MQHSARGRGDPATTRRDNSRRRNRRIAATTVAIIAGTAIAAGIGLYNRSADSTGPLPVQLPTTPQSYLGVYVRSAPASYAGVTAFANATGARPDLVMYYSGWYVPFPVAFAATAASNGAVPLVQMDPDSKKDKISIAGIAAGR
jgi:Glycosyl hydrolase family 26